MENSTELVFQSNQIGLIFVPVYIFNQKIEEISTEIKQLEKKQAQEEYLTIEVFALSKKIEKKKQELQKLIDSEDTRRKNLEHKISQIDNFYQKHKDLFNLSFIVWQHPMDTTHEILLKKYFHMIGQQEMIFELAPKLGWDIGNQTILTPYHFMMDLTIHRAQKLNLVFVPENETEWFKQFIKPIRDLNKKIIKIKIDDVQIIILNF